MISALVLGLALAAAPTDTLVRVPGSALRLGWSEQRTSALGAFRPGAAVAGGEVREGEVRWFGSPARASLTYRSGRLAEARLVSSAASPRLAGYVPDELRRRGYRRVGDVLTSGTSVSEWEGASNIRLTIGGGSVKAEVSPRSRPVFEKPVAAPGVPGGGLPSAAPGGPGGERPSAAPGVGLPSPASAGDGAPPLDFTREGGADSLLAPRRAVTPADPVRPRMAVDAGVFGRVMVRARVDVEGVVEQVEIERGIAELNHEALTWAGAVRFEPYLHRGRAVPFVVRIPVTFLPARAAGPSGTP